MNEARVTLAIDQTTNDLILDQIGNLVLRTDAEAVAQHARERVLHLEGEWFLDTSAGVPWLERVMGRQFDPALAEALVKAEIVDTDGVSDITSFSIRWNGRTRHLAVPEVTIQTEYDVEARL